jgi:hypothetical protein
MTDDRARLARISHTFEQTRRPARVEDLRKQYTELQKRHEHTTKALGFISTDATIYGRAQSPCIWRGYIEDERPTNQIREVLSNMLATMDPNDIIATFWVVASVCDGIGQGTYLHVIDQIRQLLAGYHATMLEIKVVRVRSVYRESVEPTAKRTAFWSLLTHFGYIQSYWEAGLLGSTSGQLTYFYIEVPDDGVGDTEYRDEMPSWFRPSQLSRTTKPFSSSRSC